MEKDEKNTKLHFEYIPLKHKDLVWCDLILFVFSIIWLLFKLGKKELIYQ